MWVVSRPPHIQPSVKPQPPTPARPAAPALDQRLVGPGFQEIARKYAGQADAAAYLSGKVKAGSVGIWGTIAMAAQTLGDADARAIAAWLIDGARP